MAALLLISSAIVVAVALPLGWPGDAPHGAGNNGPLNAGAAGAVGSRASRDQLSGGTTLASDRQGSRDLPSTPERARALKANEMGLVPVLMYHAIRESIVPPDRLRDDIVRLKAAGFYPTTIRELAEGNMDIPAGKSPVVLTFDDSSPTHYRILDDGTLDPNSVIAILQAAVEEGDWAPKASFFPLLYVDPPTNIVFGQPEYAEQKLRNLVDWGFEIGSHTLTHQDLSATSPSRVKKELAQSKARLEGMIGGGYRVYTLNPPYGEYPDDESLLASGEYEGTSYDYSAVVMAWGGRAPSPFSGKFDPMHIPRITAYPSNTVRDLIEYFRLHPELRHISDGDPDSVSAPFDIPAGLGVLRGDLRWKVVRY